MPSSPRSPSKEPAEKLSYHHGDLAKALIDAARELLETEGLTKLSLRAAARRAGVSQAAPYHHFKDKQALLASVAAQGHRDFNAAMVARMQTATGPGPQLLACGVAYVQFATDNPALFRLMFGSTIEHCDAYPELVEAGGRSFQTLNDAMRSVMRPDARPASGAAADAHASSDVASKATTSSGLQADMLRLRSLKAWCSVHGLSTLLIDGGLDPRDFGVETAAELAMRLLTTGD